MTFDHIANGYDKDFTHSKTGILQRKRVYVHLENLLQKKEVITVLELNCGTGEDAIWWAKKGCEILATDISTKMIEIAQKKAIINNFQDKIHFKNIAIQKLFLLAQEGKKFDLIFSNFGGLNCLSPDDLKKLNSTLSELLNPNGFFVAVLMPRFCFWETFYFTIKGQFRKAWRRRSRTAIPAALSADIFVDTWYYSPKEFYRFFESFFEYQEAAPIGFALPPSYLDNWFKDKDSIVNFLSKMEDKVPNILAGAADHSLIILSKKK